MKNSIKTLIAASLCLTASGAWAIASGPSNLAGQVYPHHPCLVPHIPSGADASAVASFKKGFDIYTNCMSAYVEAADNDVQRIRDAQDSARQELQTVLDAVRRWSAGPH